MGSLKRLIAKKEDTGVPVPREDSGLLHLVNGEDRPERLSGSAETELSDEMELGELPVESAPADFFQSSIAAQTAPVPPAEVVQQPPAVPEPRKFGWMSPKYNVSRRVDLDPGKVEENRCVGFRSDAPEVDSYRILRTQILQRTADGKGNAIMITSAVPGEGKTLTAINLALTFAREFKQTALLVDCDLKKQQMQDYLGFAGEKGLVDYLLYDCPIADLMIWPGIEKLTLITGGRTIEESTELLGSPRMKDLVSEMKDRYPERFIFFDVPAVLGSADALAFAPLVDHILVTVRADQTSVEQINRAVEMLPKDKLLGVVLNGELKRNSPK